MKIRGYNIDLHTNNVNEHFALVYVPGRHRNRFAENCVTVVDTEEQCLALADRSKHLRAAKVLGPCRSSESVNLYYLLHWLEDCQVDPDRH